MVSDDTVLFVPVPLIALFNAEQNSLLNLIDRQSEVIMDQIAEAGNDRPPEVRIREVSSEGVARLTFTNNMIFPDDLKDTINEQAKKVEPRKLATTSEDG